MDIDPATTIAVSFLIREDEPYIVPYAFLTLI